MLRTLHELGGGCFLAQPLQLGDAPTPADVKKAFFRAVRAVHPDKQSQANNNQASATTGIDHVSKPLVVRQTRKALTTPT